MKENIKIAFFDSKPYDKKSFEEANKNYGFNIKFFGAHLTQDTAELTKGYDAVCVFVNDFIDRQIADVLVKNGVKLIALRCAGYNNVDLKAVYGRIHVVRVPAYSPFAVAEHAAALMLSLNRKIHKAYYRIRDNNFSINGFLGFDMNDKTVGIIGAGKIGRILMKILLGFGMKVIVYDKYPDNDFAAKAGIRYVELDELFRESDIISLHCPLTGETRHLINNETINKLKDGVMVINTGRGQLIDTKALIKGLKSGKIGSAGLDVYEEESEYFFEDYSISNIGDDVLARLLTFNNVLITSHQAFFTKEALSNISDTTLNNIKDYAEGKELVNEICYRCGSAVCMKKEKGKCF
jgi:D-lactate dehydrogenase